MTSVPRRRLQALSEQLSLPPPDLGTFENIPKIRQIAPDSAGHDLSLAQMADGKITEESRIKSSSSPVRINHLPPSHPP
ncbi:MAG: hypothetical protein Q9223_003760 [Gallowayella weberi]